MSILGKILKLLPLLLLLLKQINCILEDSEVPVQQLLHLNDIVSNRINSMLKQHEDLQTHSDNKELLQQYTLLASAVTLPVSQLDKKIRAYNAYLESLEHHQELNANSSSKAQELRNSQSASKDQDDEVLSRLLDSNNGRLFITSSAFEKRVLKILSKLGIYDGFTMKVFKAIFSDKKQLKKLKKKLDELDDDKNDDCCLWDFIFDLF